MDLDDITMKSLRYIVIYNNNLLYKVIAADKNITVDFIEKNNAISKYTIKYVDKFGNESDAAATIQ